MGSGERDGKRASFNGTATGNRGGMICSRFAMRSALWTVRKHLHCAAHQDGGYMLVLRDCLP
jgi:hypothetical protein